MNPSGYAPDGSTGTKTDRWESDITPNAPKTDGFFDGPLRELCQVILANGLDLEITPGATIKIHVSVKRG
jgi:hypothetical protein